MHVHDLSSLEFTFQIGLPPVRIDVITAIDGLDFEPAWSRRIRASLDELPVWVLSRADLITNKRAAGRTQDMADVEHLENTPPGS